jgi:uncharacterized metal-binding protein YceD (DUF177 family)
MSRSAGVEFWISKAEKEKKLDLLASYCYICCLNSGNVKIHLPTYPRGVHRIAETVAAKDLDLDPEVFFTPLNATLVMDRHDPYLQFEFEIETVTRHECDRCLNLFERPYHVRAPMLYVLGKDPANGEADDSEISYVPVNTVDLDITGDLRDFIILNLPNRSLCSEECRGLCSQCGADLNQQPCPHVSSSSQTA